MSCVYAIIDHNRQAPYILAACAIRMSRLDGAPQALDQMARVGAHPSSKTVPAKSRVGKSSSPWPRNVKRAVGFQL